MMMATIDDLALIYPDRILLEFSQSEREKAWQQSQADRYSHPTARWNAYLNCLCLNLFLSYLETELDRREKPIVLPTKESLPSIWEVVNGTAIQMGEKRLILIPSEHDYLSEFRVPREWLDIPNWAGNYYLPVEIDLEAGWMQVWGYATYEQLKTTGRDRADETYVLPAEELIEDSSVLWVASELDPDRKPQVKPLPTITAIEANDLIAQLQQPTPYSPRLEVPFIKWAALLANDLYRQKLYQRRLQSLETSNNLARWFESVFQAGWQSLDAFLVGNAENLAYNLRHGQKLREARQVAVEGVKLIDLGVQLGEQSVALLVGLTKEADQQVGIRVQLYPVGGQTYLPQKIKLTLLSPSGTALQESQARIQDNLIQLKRFTCSVGTNFKIQVAIDRFSITEDFQIQPS
jgi:hypothetical protein